MNDEQAIVLWYLLTLLLVRSIVWVYDHHTTIDYCLGPDKPNNCLYSEGV